MAIAIKSMRKVGVYSILLFWLTTSLRAQDIGSNPSTKNQLAAAKADEAPPTVSKPAPRFRRESTEAKPATKVEPLDLTLPAKTVAPSMAPRTLSEDSRDPFRPATLRKKVTARPRENLSPLERFDLNQLRIVGVIWDMKEPRAMVEDTAGLGYTIKVGTPIGSNDGVVKAIHRNEIVVEEFSYDVYGTRKRREISMKLLTE